MTFEEFADDCYDGYHSGTSAVETALDNTFQEMTEDVCKESETAWVDLCSLDDNNLDAAIIALQKFCRKIQNLANNGTDFNRTKNAEIFGDLWQAVIGCYERMISDYEYELLDDAGDDDIADELREACDSTTYFRKTNETYYPASWAGYETGRGTGLAEDCTTSTHYNCRISLAAHHVAGEHDVEISDDDCDSLESAAAAIRAAINELEIAS